jgi:hypothetical protein
LQSVTKAPRWSSLSGWTLEASCSGAVETGPFFLVTVLAGEPPLPLRGPGFLGGPRRKWVLKTLALIPNEAPPHPSGSCTRALGHLEAQGFVKRASGEMEGPCQEWQLTPLGKDTLPLSLKLTKPRYLRTLGRGSFAPEQLMMFELLELLSANGWVGQAAASTGGQRCGVSFAVSNTGALCGGRAQTVVGAGEAT